MFVLLLCAQNYKINNFLLIYFFLHWYWILCLDFFLCSLYIFITILSSSSNNVSDWSR